MRRGASAGGRISASVTMSGPLSWRKRRDSLGGAPRAVQTAPPEYVCEEDADDFCEDADDACEPEIADDEGEPLVAEPEGAPAPCVRNPTTQGSRHVTTYTRFLTRR